MFCTELGGTPAVACRYEVMDDPQKRALIGRIHALLARAAKARQEWRDAKTASNGRLRVLAETTSMWRRKCEDWLAKAKRRDR